MLTRIAAGRVGWAKARGAPVYNAQCDWRAPCPRAMPHIDSRCVGTARSNRITHCERGVPRLCPPLRDLAPLGLRDRNRPFAELAPVQLDHARRQETVRRTDDHLDVVVGDVEAGG